MLIQPVQRVQAIGYGRKDKAHTEVKKPTQPVNGMSFRDVLEARCDRRGIN